MRNESPDIIADCMDALREIVDLLEKEEGEEK